MKHNYFWLDTETRNRLDLTKVGAQVYVEDPTLEVIIFSGAYGDSAPFAHDYLSTGRDLDDEHKHRLESPEYTKVAWNATFDFLVLKHAYPELKLDIAQWVDAMAWAYSLSLPGSLDKACLALDLPYDDRKERDGKRLINLFCKPFKGARFRTPETHAADWDKFLTYAIQDTRAMRSAYQKMRKYLPLTYPRSEHEVWLMDFEINQTGLPVDLDYARHAVEFDALYRKQRFERAQLLTGLDNPTSPQQLQHWLADQGHELPNMQAQTLRDYLEAHT